MLIIYNVIQTWPIHITATQYEREKSPQALDMILVLHISLKVGLLVIQFVTFCAFENMEQTLNGLCMKTECFSFEIGMLL